MTNELGMLPLKESQCVFKMLPQSQGGELYQMLEQVFKMVDIMGADEHAIFPLVQAEETAMYSMLSQTVHIDR